MLCVIHPRIVQLSLPSMLIYFLQLSQLDSFGTEILFICYDPARDTDVISPGPETSRAVVLARVSKRSIPFFGEVCWGGRPKQTTEGGGAKAIG